MSTICIEPAYGVRGYPSSPADFHWMERWQYQPIDCNRCDYAGRGEAQEPLQLGPIRDVHDAM